MDDNIKKIIEKAETGDIEQILKVAEWYEDRKEYKKALYWVIKGALQKNDIAQYTIGYFFEYGLGVKKNEKKAIIWYEKSAEQGNPVVQYNLASLYEKRKMYDKALYWYEKSANQGILEAQNDLAYLYEKIFKEYELAFKWYIKAAEQDYVDAQFNLAVLYERGLGVKQDYKQAFRWYKKAAENGDAEAQSVVGSYYLFGKGTSQDYELAERSFLISLNNGNKGSKYYVNIFKKIKNKKIKEIESLRPYIYKDIEEDIEAVFIKPDKNAYIRSHTLYDIETFNKIKKQLENILEDIPEVKNDGTNEVDVFKAICKKIVELVSFDHNAVDENEEEYFTKEYTSGNLIGALIEGKCVCAGYAELLRNLCLCRKIDCIFIGLENHAFNQVKIGGIWYYFDITSYLKEIKRGEPVENFLLSEKKFKFMGNYDKLQESQYTYESIYCYNEKGISLIINNALCDVGTTGVNRAESAINYKNINEHSV